MGLVVRAGPALFYLAGELSKSGECDAQRGIEARLRFIAGMRPVRVRNIYVPHFAVENENNWSRYEHPQQGRRIETPGR